MKEMALTTTETGEKTSNFKRLGEQDLVIGDRGYCNKQGIAYNIEEGSGFLFRFETKRFHVYDREGRKVNVVGYFTGLKSRGIGEQALLYEYEGERKPLRFCVMRKTKEAKEKSLETLWKTQIRKYRNKKLSGAQRAYNRYVIMITSISDESLNCSWTCTARGGR
jgi:hypothetical protein